MEHMIDEILINPVQEVKERISDYFHVEVVFKKTGNLLYDDLLTEINNNSSIQIGKVRRKVEEKIDTIHYWPIYIEIKINIKKLYD